MFSISHWISYLELQKDQKKTPAQLVGEMEKHFYFQDAVITSIILKKDTPHNMVEFRTHDGMFTTIHAALYPMLLCECRDETVTKVMDIEKNDFGWDFPEPLLPYMKQLIYKAIKVHDLRAPEDKPGGKM